MTRRLAGGIAAVATGFTLVLVPGVAQAKIVPVDTSCTNGGNQTPTGQQPTCNNTNGLTQNTENQNPAGSAPPGQNK